MASHQQYEKKIRLLTRRDLLIIDDFLLHTITEEREVKILFEIMEKAKLDGEYVQKMSFAFDVKCFVGTIFSVLRSDGVVEGGTGEMKKNKQG